MSVIIQIRLFLGFVQGSIWHPIRLPGGIENVQVFSKLSHTIAVLATCGWLSKLWSLLGSLVKYGTYYLGYPKRDFNFDNYPSLVLGKRLWCALAGG